MSDADDIAVIKRAQRIAGRNAMKLTREHVRQAENELGKTLTIHTRKR